MTVTPQQIETFAPIKWATPFLVSPDWKVRDRMRGIPLEEDGDRFCKDTMWQRNGVQSWVELYKKPPQGSKAVTKTISLCKYDSGLMGFTGICHGGAAMTLMDEALGFAMVANETEKLGDWAKMSLDWAGLLKKGRPITEVLNGMMVTAKLDHTFLRPVLCPGIVGIEVVVLEDKEYKMRMRGVMKDGDGNPLLQADGLWVRIGGSRL